MSIKSDMSTIEPGYSGDLTCLFVNFGKVKVVFLKLTGTLPHPMTHTEPRESGDHNPYPKLSSKLASLAA